MTVSLTTANYPNKHAFDNTKEFCYILKKIVKSCNGDRKEVLEEKYPNICLNMLEIDIIVTKCQIVTKNLNITKELKEYVVDYAKDNIAKINVFFKGSLI